MVFCLGLFTFSHDDYPPWDKLRDAISENYPKIIYFLHAMVPGTKSCTLLVELFQLVHCVLFYFFNNYFETLRVSISFLIRIIAIVCSFNGGTYWCFLPIMVSTFIIKYLFSPTGIQQSFLGFFLFCFVFGIKTKLSSHLYC